MDKGEIWIVEFPSVSVHEQVGKRPVIMIAETKTNICVVIPMTSSLQSQRFPHILKIKSSEFNKLDSDSIALIFHIRAIDKRRLIKRIGMLEIEYINQINEILKRFLLL